MNHLRLKVMFTSSLQATAETKMTNNGDKLIHISSHLADDWLTEQDPALLTESHSRMSVLPLRILATLFKSKVVLAWNSLTHVLHL